MYNIAIIPARSGSKGLVNKNIKILNKKPLIAYTIEAALKSKLFDRVIVSTDSEVYAEIATKYGAEVPYLRAEKLASDQSTTLEVILDVLENIGNVSTFALLQPTSPFRNEKHIIEAYNLLYNENANSVISVCLTKDKYELINLIDDTLEMENFLNKNTSTLRQNYKKYYTLNGSIYISKVKEYKKYKTFFMPNSKAYFMDNIVSLDIDDKFDFWLAEKLIEDRLVELK